MVVNNLDVEGASPLPPETDAPLPIDPNAVTPGGGAKKRISPPRWPDSIDVAHASRLLK
jgi:hypothetical protein